MSTRHEFVLLANAPGACLSQLCERFAISRKTAYKWLDRFDREGSAGLADRSRRPHTSPARSDAALEAQVLDLHRAYPCWGPRKLQALLAPLQRPHHSTIAAILRRHGCRVEGTPGREPAPLRFEHAAPNQLWQMDFKGHFALTQARAGRCHPLTVLDDHSRFALCLQALPDERGAAVQATLTEVFRRYGLPERISADNGPPWGARSAQGLSVLGVWLIRLGVRLGHSRPYHPQTQGKDERFHRTLKRELLLREGFSSHAACQQAFDRWRDCYNLIRPHEALDQQPPISRYEASARRFPEQLPPVEYDDGVRVLKVKCKGNIALRGQSIFLSEALAGQYVALQPGDESGLIDICFCHQRIKQIDLRTTTNRP